MSAKHTPGPWLRDASSGMKCDVRAANGRNVALCWGLAANHESNYKVRYRAECDANAHLIAAAPDLLEAAQAAWNCIGELPPTQARVEVAQLLQAAIEKAIGEQP